MPNSDEMIRSELVPLVPNTTPVIAPLAPSQDTTPDQLNSFYRQVSIPFVRHSPLPVQALGAAGAATKSISQTQAGRTVYGVGRNLQQVPISTLAQGITSTVNSNSDTVTKTLSNLPTTTTLTGAWTNPGSAIDNDQGSYASISVTAANGVFLATGFASFTNWFDTNLLTVVTQVTAITGTSPVLVEYSFDAGNSFNTLRSTTAVDAMPVTSTFSVPLTIPTQNVQVRITTPGSAGGGSAGNKSAAPATVADGGGPQAWTPSTGTSANAYSTANNSVVTNALNLTNFGFGATIPAGSTINGIKVSVNCKGNGANNHAGSVLLVLESSVTLLNVGGTSDKSMGRVYATGTGSTFTYGGSTDLWSAATPTYANVTNAAFGVAIAAYLENDGLYTGARAQVSSTSITVYYTTAAGSATSTTRIYYISQEASLG